MQKNKAHIRRLQWLLPVATVALVVLMMQLFLGRISGQLRTLSPVDGMLDITGPERQQRSPRTATILSTAHTASSSGLCRSDIIPSAPILSTTAHECS